MVINTNFGKIEIHNIWSKSEEAYVHPELKVGDVIMAVHEDDFYSTSRDIFIIDAIFPQHYVLTLLNSYMGTYK